MRDPNMLNCVHDMCVADFYHVWGEHLWDLLEHKHRLTSIAGVADPLNLVILYPL